MKPKTFIPSTGTSSLPQDPNSFTGAGSIFALMVSRGVAVCRHTIQGTIRPFGQDTGTADDASLLKKSTER